jgi:hypothetical protein
LGVTALLVSLALAACSPPKEFARFRVEVTGGPTPSVAVVEVSAVFGSVCYSTQGLRATSAHIHIDSDPSSVVVSLPLPQDQVDDSCARGIPDDAARDILEHPENYFLELHDEGSGQVFRANLDAVPSIPPTAYLSSVRD